MGLRTLVTFLEMTQPPCSYRKKPPLPDLKLDFGYPLSPDAYVRLVDGVGRAFHWVDTLRLPRSALHSRIDDPDRTMGIVKIDCYPAGLFEIAPVGADEIEIVYLGLMPHATGSGLGKWLLDSALQAAWTKRPRSVVVRTCTLDHPAALPLYLKAGFRAVGQQWDTVEPLTSAEIRACPFPLNDEQNR